MKFKALRTKKEPKEFVEICKKDNDIEQCNTLPESYLS